MRAKYKTHIQNRGWEKEVFDGETSGTVGLGLRMEALIINLIEKGSDNVSIEAQAHVQNVGWQDIKTDGQIIGTVGESLRLEALRIRLVGPHAYKYSIEYRVHVENYGWLLWKKDGDTAGTTNVALRAEAIEIRIVKLKIDTPDVVTPVPVVPPVHKIITDISIPPEKTLCAVYSSHIQNYGWLPNVSSGRLSGRVGQGLRMEAIRISLSNIGTLGLGVAYSVHVENQGWQEEKTDGQTAGTTDQGLRLEAIKIRLTGIDSDKYSIWYRTHVQNEAWGEWSRDGEVSGTTGKALRTEAIQIIITLKTQSIIRIPGISPMIATEYRSHIENISWGAWVKNGIKSGTTGRGLRMEAFELVLSSLDGLDVGVTYRVHIQNQGWQEWKANGQMAGTTGQGLRLEAIEIKLTGSDAARFSIQYRGHLENSGWMDWVRDGAMLGTVGESRRLEAISVVIIEKTDYQKNITNEIKNQAPYFQIWASNYPEPEVLLHDIRTVNKVLNPKLVEGINKSSSLIS